MASLSQEQVEQFTELLGEIRTVDLSVHGITPKSKQVNLSQEELIEKADAEARELAEKTEKPLHECMAEIYKKHNLVG